MPKNENRLNRINEELRKEISQIISFELKNPDVTGLISVTKVKITPDFKYATSFMSEKYSLAKDYPIVAKNAIKECLRQVPNNIYDENGKILKGVIIRHLVLPNHLLNTKNVLSIIQSEYGKDVSVSIMAQYFPTYKAIEIEKLNRKITKKEYEKVMEYLEELNLNNGYIQELEDNEEKYVPLFDLRTLE